MKSNKPLYYARRPESKESHKPGNLPMMYFLPSEGGEEDICFSDITPLPHILKGSGFLLLNLYRGDAVWNF